MYIPRIWDITINRYIHIQQYILLPLLAYNYSYLLAAVVSCTRVLSVERLLLSASRDEQTDEDRERFLQHRGKYLANGSYSLMSEAFRSLVYKVITLLTPNQSLRHNA
jgi:hypothetical protein